MSLPGHESGSDWRSALAGLNPAVARAEATPHAAQLLLSRGLNAEAEAALREFLVRSPDHLQALKALGMLLRRGGRGDEAAAILTRAAGVEAGTFGVPAGAGGSVADFLAAADQCGPPPAAAPVDFVTAVFDAAAGRYDALLQESLAYRAPEALFAAVSPGAGPAVQNLDVLDLGCGTGLAGTLFRPVARTLDGVDLSPGMLAEAAAKGVYDTLSTGEIVAHLGGTDRQYDLIVAADVFIYLGDLVPVFSAARRVLRPGGRLAFTVETCDGDDFRLQNVRRYAHPRGYLTRAAETTGFTVRHHEETSVRTESLRPVRSAVCVWAKVP